MFMSVLGEGAPKNKVKAVKWFQKAADQGHADAQVNLAHCYEHGLGISKNKGQALIWLQKAADQGHESAKKLCQEAADLDSQK
jgi:TPR repeat protein